MYSQFEKRQSIDQKNTIGLRRNKITSDILKKEYKRFLNLKKKK